MKKLISILLTLAVMMQSVLCTKVLAADASLYEYEPGNIILGKNNMLSWKNPKSEKLQSVKAYIVADNGEEAEVTSRLTAVSAAGVPAAINTPSAIVHLSDASDSTNMKTSCRLIFVFSDGTVRNIFWEDSYKTTAQFIQQQHSLTANPNSEGAYLNVDVYNAGASAVAMLSDSIVKSGERSVRFESNNVNNTHFQLLFGGLTANTAYDVSMWVNTIEESNYNFSGISMTLPDTGGEWQNITFEYTPSADNFGIKPVGASREVYFDDISFTPKGEASPILTMGFETKTVAASGSIEAADVFCGDKTVKLKWTEQYRAATNYINVYEQLSDGTLALRARVEQAGATGVTLTSLENDIEHTFVIKIQNDNNAWGYGLEGDGVIVTATPHLYSDKLSIVQALESWAEELAHLVGECNAKGIYPSYETTDAKLVGVYAKKLRDSYECFVYDDFEKYMAEVERIYNETRQKLSDILDGTLEAVNVPEYEISSNEIKNGSVITKSADEERQLVEIGFSGFYAYDNDIADMNAIGVRAIQHDGLEKGPTHFLSYDESLQDYALDEERIDEELTEFRKTMDLCRKKGIMVDMGIPLHYSEDVSGKSGASDYRSEGGSYGTFINFNPTSPTAKKMIKKYFEAYIPVIYEYKDIVSSITFANEPYFEAWDKSYYYEEWTAFLTDKYGSISAINDAYDTEYEAIDEVKMPEYIPGRDKNDTEQWTTTLHMDYRLFVTDIMYEFFDFCIAEIDKYTNGEIPCGVKTMQFFRSYMPRWMDSYIREISYDYEKVSKLFDFNGMDSFSYYNDSNGNREKSITIPAKLSWYDFTTSVKNAPIIETEAHVAVDFMNGDDEMDDTEILSDYMSASVWMGAIHGADLTAAWTYADDERVAGEQHNMKNTIFLRRPDALQKLSHTALDARRLSEEINAVQNVKREVAILYSYDCFMYNLQYQSNLFTAYEILTQKGQKPLFVTENSLDKLSECKLLVIPGNMITTEAMVNTLSDYISGGGRVAFIGQDCFSRDKNNKDITDIIMLFKTAGLKHNSTVISANLSDDTSMSDFSADAADKIEIILKELGLMNIRLVDKTTDATADVEWNTAEYNGETLISACNYSDEAVAVKVEYDGEIRTGIDDIKNMEYNLAEVKLEPYKPVLLSLPDKRLDMSLFNSDDEEVYKVSAGTYKAVLTLANYESSNAITAQMFAAVYKDDRLEKLYPSEQISVRYGEAQINDIIVPDTQNGNYSVKLMLWDGLGLCKPLSEAKTFFE